MRRRIKVTAVTTIVLALLYILLLLADEYGSLVLDEELIEFVLIIGLGAQIIVWILNYTRPKMNLYFLAVLSHVITVVVYVIIMISTLELAGP